VAESLDADDGPTVILPTHLRCASHTLSLVGTTDASSALKASASFSRLNHAAMGKCSALWNASNRPKSAEVIADICMWMPVYNSVCYQMEFTLRQYIQAS
jgi:hypothetical protein